MNILAVGDVVGSSGLDFLCSRLKPLIHEYAIDFTVVNGENASGVGLTPEQADQMLAYGADVVTLGNHSFSRDAIKPYLEDSRRVIRPANLSPLSPGIGWTVAESNSGEVAVINLIGRCDMDFGPDNPFFEADRILKKLTARVILVDFHAEATSEKLAMAYYLEGRVSALWGTHTHVQTSDAGVLEGGTGMITDLGMTGPVRSVIGVRPEQSIALFTGAGRMRFDPAPGRCKLEGCIFTVDEKTGRCSAAKELRVL